MTTLAKDTPRNFGQGDMNDLPVIAADIIYEGAFVGENASGYSRPLQAGDPFQGVCVRQADNSSGAAGAINVRVRTRGILSRVAVTGATAVTANDGAPVYASDDNTLTLTAGSNTYIGNVQRWISSGLCDVQFDTPRNAGTVSLADLDSGIKYSHMVVYAGEVTWTGGGATLAQTVTGALETDLVVASFHTLGTEGTILQGAYVSAANTITYTLDAANTSNDAVITYTVFRAAS